MPATDVNLDSIGCEDSRRFELELEFMQCLASPHYLNWLAQNDLLNDPALVSFLNYLQYWLRPEYSTFIIYPHSLFFLELLQSSEFRKSLASTATKDLIHGQQFFFWQHYRANRIAAADRMSEARAANSSNQADAIQKRAN